MENKCKDSKNFYLADTRSKSLRLLRNSVAVNAVYAVGKQLVNYINDKIHLEGAQTKFFDLLLII